MRIAIRRLLTGSKPSAQSSSSGPMWPQCVADFLESAGTIGLVVESLRLETKRQRLSTTPNHADGAEDAELI
jgi:hypothetical protein